MNGVTQNAGGGVLAKMAEINQQAKGEYTARRGEAQASVNAVDELMARLKNLQTEVKNLDESTDFLVRTGSVGNVDDPSFSVSVTAGATMGTNSIEVVNLATATVVSGLVDVGKGVSASNDVSGVTLSSIPIRTGLTSGVFTVNGVQIELYSAGTTPTAGVNVALSGSLQDLFNAISTATGGDVTASYDYTTDKVTLTSSGVIKLGSGADTSNCLSALRLFGNGTGSVVSESGLGSVQLSNSIQNGNLTTSVSGSGSFTINGVSFSYNAGTTTLGGLMADINTSKAGVIMMYDPNDDRFILKNKDTGSISVKMADVSGSLLSALGLSGGSTTLGVNAKVKVNGGSAMSSMKNEVDSSVHGLSGVVLNLKKVGTDTVTVSQDVEGLYKKVESFIGKYNEVESYIRLKSKTTVTTSPVRTKLGGEQLATVTKEPLAGVSVARALGSELRSAVFNGVSSLAGGEMARLMDVGIGFVKGEKGSTNELYIEDGVALREAIGSDPDTFSKLFLDSVDGVVAKVNKLADSYLGTKGFLKGSKNVLESNVRDIDKKLKKLDDDYEKLYQKYKSDMAKVEIAQMQAQNTMNFINARFGGG